MTLVSSDGRSHLSKKPVPVRCGQMPGPEEVRYVVELSPILSKQWLGLHSGTAHEKVPFGLLHSCHGWISGPREGAGCERGRHEMGKHLSGEDVLPSVLPFRCQVPDLIGGFWKGRSEGQPWIDHHEIDKHSDSTGNPNDRALQTLMAQLGAMISPGGSC